MHRLVLLLLLFCGSVYADLLTGKVVAIADGDTLTILVNNRQHKIRLAGIDAPERKQAFGTTSRQSLASMAFGKVATVEYHKKDRYGRLVGKIFVNGQDVCLTQVQRGMAWFYKQYEREQSAQDRAAYAAAEVQARAARVGLWRDPQPVPPWEFRRARKTGS